MSEPRYACRRCGTWKCSACDGQRANTDVRYVNYPCNRCRGLTGTLIPTMHTAKMWGTHNDGPLPMAYPYGERPLAGEWGSGFGSRDVPQPQYRGVPVPANIRLNPESFRRGVDAALERYGIPADTPLKVTIDESAQPQFEVIRATEAEAEADHTPQAREFRYEVCQRPFSAAAALGSRQRVHLDRAASVPVTRTNSDIAPEAPQKANEHSPEEKG